MPANHSPPAAALAAVVWCGAQASMAPDSALSHATADRVVSLELPFVRAVVAEAERIRSMPSAPIR